MPLIVQSDEHKKKLKTGITRHILVVDNDCDNLNVISKGLEMRGFLTTTSDNPSKAADDFKADKFACLLTDVQMPQMNGYELYRIVHEIDPSMKVCFLTGHNEYSEQFRTYFPDMDEKCFVNKPIRISHLADRLTSIIDS